MSPPSRFVLALIVLAASACTTLSPPPGPSEQEARAVFTQLVSAARAKDRTRFQALIAPADLREMAALEKEKPGFIEMFMELVAAGGDPAGYQAQVKDDQVRFIRRVETRTKDMSGTETTTVTMIRQDGRWWFGKPRP